MKRARQREPLTARRNQNAFLQFPDPDESNPPKMGPTAGLITIKFTVLVSSAHSEIAEKVQRRYTP